MPTHIANCLFWVLVARWRLGGYILVRESLSRWHLNLWLFTLSGRVPHFLHMSADRRHIVSFVPCRRPDHPSPLYIMVFVGSMRWGDHHAGKPYLRNQRGKLLLLRATLLVTTLGTLFVLAMLWWVWRAVRFLIWVI